MNIIPIKKESDYEATLERINELWGAPADTPEGDELDILLDLVSAYEEKHHSIEPSDPIEAIKFRMDQMGLSHEDMVQYLGQRSRVSEVLNKRRKLTLDMIRRLSEGLNIPASCLILDYSLIGYSGPT